MFDEAIKIKQIYFWDADEAIQLVSNCSIQKSELKAKKIGTLNQRSVDESIRTKKGLIQSADTKIEI